VAVQGHTVLALERVVIARVLALLVAVVLLSQQLQ
jgi:hypothetical protein